MPSEFARLGMSLGLFSPFYHASAHLTPHYTPPTSPPPHPHRRRLSTHDAHRYNSAHARHYEISATMKCSCMIILENEFEARTALTTALTKERRRQLDPVVRDPPAPHQAKRVGFTPFSRHPSDSAQLIIVTNHCEQRPPTHFSPSMTSQPP